MYKKLAWSLTTIFVATANGMNQRPVSKYDNLINTIREYGFSTEEAERFAYQHSLSSRTDFRAPVLIKLNRQADIAYPRRSRRG